MATLRDSLLRRVRYVRQTGNGHFALLVAAFAPSSVPSCHGLNADYLPKEFELAALKGLSETLGDLNCCCKLVDGAFHEVDSRVRDFEHAGRLLAKEIAEEPRGPAPADPPDPELLHRQWIQRWDAIQEEVLEGLGASLAELGFEVEEKSLVRETNGLHQRLEVVGDAPRLPAAVDLRLTLQHRSQTLGSLSLARQLERPSWKLEAAKAGQDLLRAFEPTWLMQSCDPVQLVELHPPGLYWWSAVVEARLLLLAARPAEARVRVEGGLQELRGKVGRRREVEDLEALLRELG